MYIIYIYNVHVACVYACSLIIKYDLHMTKELNIPKDPWNFRKPRLPRLRKPEGLCRGDGRAAAFTLDTSQGQRTRNPQEGHWTAAWLKSHDCHVARCGNCWCGRVWTHCGAASVVLKCFECIQTIFWMVGVGSNRFLDLSWLPWPFFEPVHVYKFSQNVDANWWS